MFKALATVMSEKGYIDTTVADIVKHARVSRPTFYEQFDSKQDCFMAGYARLQQHVIDGVLATPTTGTPMQRFDAMLTNYLTALASDPATSRLYLVEVSAAGPEAMGRRMQMQQRFVTGVASIFKARSKVDRFACQALVAAISQLVTNALVDGGADAVMALRKPLSTYAERAMLGGGQPAAK